MKLSIVIPAFNEEDSISFIIKKCLKEKINIINRTYVDDVEIIVVNDGSNDKTKEISESFDGIKVISHDKNLGYGTALKTGFSSTSGDLIGFLDADGTCEPMYFVGLINVIERENADIVLASRMGIGSEMPKIRRLGNKLFALLISLIGSTYVSDSSSGFRVLQRDCLPKLYPLPNGLHFVTAMSTRAVLDKNIKIVEMPIKYKERVGKSKLHVFKDGIKFLSTILEIGLTYKPFKFYLILGIILFIFSIYLSIKPIIHTIISNNIDNINYLTHPSINIYRLITIIVLILSGISFIFTGLLAEKIKETIDNHLLLIQSNSIEFKFNSHLYKLLFFSLISFLCAILLNMDTIKQYVNIGFVDVNWLFVIFGALLVLISVQLFSFGIILRILLIYNRRVDSNKHLTDKNTKMKDKK